MSEFARLSPSEEQMLQDYAGAKFETYASGTGELIEVVDTRVPELHVLVIKKDFKLIIAERYSIYPQHKIDAARANTLDDSAERNEILALDEELKREYSLRKAKMNEHLANAQAAEDANDLDLMRSEMDMMQEVALSPLWQVIDYPNYLTLGLTKRYKLEKIIP